MALSGHNTGFDFGTLEPLGLLELYFFGILVVSASLNCLQRKFYYNRGLIRQF